MKTYVISEVEELEAVLADIVGPRPEPRKNKLIDICPQDEKDLYALALEAHAERFAPINARISSIFAEMAKAERTGH